MNKLSKYNYFIPEGDRVIYFNGISNEVFSLSQQEHEKMQSLLKEPDEFERKYPSVFARFLNWGFIVPENKDEVKYLLLRNKEAVFSDKNYMLVINPTLECNFGCWYCYEEHPQGRMSGEVMERILKHIKYMVGQERITALNLSWFGGEPLLYFDEIVYPISLHGKKMCEEAGIPFFNSITTNASLITLDIAEKMGEINLFDFQITFDGDRKRHDKIRNEHGKPSFERIIKNINVLLARFENVNITVRINYDNRTLEICDLREIFERINTKYRKRVHIDFQRVWQTSPQQEGENAQLKFWFDMCCDLGYNQQGILPAFSIGLTHKCYTDRLYHCELNYDGKVYRCTARGYDDKYVMGELTEEGIIRWDADKMSSRYGRATFENETCLACRYLPLCMGPCSKKMEENNWSDSRGVCYLNFVEAAPEQVIVGYYRNKMKYLTEKNVQTLDKSEK